MDGLLKCFEKREVLLSDHNNISLLLLRMLMVMHDGY